MGTETREQRRPPRDQYFYVLDYMPSGPAFEGRQTHGREPIAQVIGEEYFTLLEVVPLEGLVVKPGDRIFVGRGPEDRLYSQVSRVVRPITYNELSMVAKRELENVLEMIVDINEARFVDFFNKAKPLTVKMHQLELIPGIGKKLMWEILAEREKQPFKSFADIEARVKVVGIKKKIVERILSELQGNEKYRIFVLSH